MQLIETTNASQYREAGGDCHSPENQRILERLVQREVFVCCSLLVSYFSENPDACVGDVSQENIMDLYIGKDFETPGEEHINEMDIGELLDFCEDNDLLDESDSPFTSTDDIAAIRRAVRDEAENDWSAFCEEQDVEPYDLEAYEHWAVTSWFSKKLASHGEITGELFDFDIWGRCCSGQSISMDGVIAGIAAEMQILVDQKNSWAS